MMAVHIVTDSTSDMSPALIAAVLADLYRTWRS